MPDPYVGVKAAAVVVDAWLARPDLDAHRDQVLALMAHDPDGFDALVPGLTILAGLLATEVARLSGRSTEGVLFTMLHAADDTHPQT